MTKINLEMGFMHRLRNDEFPQLIHDVFTLLEGVELHESHLTDAFDHAKRHKPALIEVGNTTGYHALTGELNEDARVRKEYLVSLKLSVQAARKTSDPEKRNFAKVLDMWIKPHNRTFQYAGINSQTRLVHRLQHAASEDARITDALEQLGLKDLFATIVSLTEAMVTKVQIRNREVVLMRKRVGEKRKLAYADFQILLTTLANWANMAGEFQEDYRAYCGDIKNFLDAYRSRLLARITLRKSTEKVSE